MNTFIRFYLLVGSILIFASAFAQKNQFQPDSTAYEYITKGGNVGAFYSDRLTTIEFDFSEEKNNPNSIKWIVPANTGVCNLFINTVDLDLRNKAVYLVCKKNNNIARLNVFANTLSGKQFKICSVLKESANGLNLPATEWHQTGGYLAGTLTNSADIADLEHVTTLSINAPNSGEETILWIDEIKTIAPRGPACAISFNRYRDQADTLLTPYLLQNNVKANIDFNYEFASTQTIETYTAVPFQSIGLPRIDTLVNIHGWSCSSHGTFYDRMPFLSKQTRYELFALDSFINAGFDARWCLSIPKDNANEVIYKEINDYGQFRSIRKQGQDINTLPISNPLDFGFFRPTSAAAGPNIGGTPLQLSEMKAYIDSCVKVKGLVVLDFGTIVANPSSIYTDVETTLLSDAIALIEYADSLGLTFVTFKDIFEDSPTYTQELTASNDYYQLKGLSLEKLPILANDMIPTGTVASISIVNQPTNGTISIVGDSIFYAPSIPCFVEDQFTYVINNGAQSDTATAYLKMMNIVFNGEKTFFCNLNKYLVEAEIRGGVAPYTYLWSNGSVTDTSTVTGASSYTVTITDVNGCSIKRTMFFPNRVSPDPYVYNSIQCDAGIPTCLVSGAGNIMWYADSAGTTLLQNGGLTFNSIIDTTTTLYVKSDYGNCNSDLVPITITVSKPTATIQLDSDTIVCNSDFIRLRAISESNLNYRWKRNGVNIPGAVNWRYITNISASYSLEVTRLSDSCAFETDPIVAVELDTAIISCDRPLTFCNGDSILLYTINTPALTYQWTRNGVPFGNNSSSVWVFDQANYTLEISGGDSCNKISAVTSTIVNCNVSVNEIQPNEVLSVYPSPADDILFVKSNFASITPREIRILDLAGRLYRREYISSTTNNQYQINIATLPSGIYFIEIGSSSQKGYARFVKM
jgi:hypothetical protein